MATPLEEKCLKAACQQIRDARTRDKANSVWLAWKVFNKHPDFLKAVKEKKATFDQLKIKL
ncbi:MAG: hypothetical protein WC341_17685 [Bacteroidales bacterium]|jgi:hypothetical protein